MTAGHKDRVVNELKAVGITTYGLLKPESRELPRIIHDDEHIGGVIYGQIGGGVSAMLVATDHRIIFIDKQLFFSTVDELTYDVVSGVRSVSAGVLNSVTLHTRIQDYTFRYVNAHCAEIFVKYIENKRLEKGTYDQPNERHEHETALPIFQNISNEKAIQFLKENDTAVLSTADRNGTVHGAVVYYLIDQNNLLYILTKSDTNKGKNVYARGQVAMTIHKPGSLKTLQIQGNAAIETDQKKKDIVLSSMIKPRIYKEGILQPPVAKLQKGSFIVIRVSVTSMSYVDYAKD